MSEVLLCAFPVRWKLAELATWMEEYFEYQPGDLEPLAKTIYEVAEPIVQKARWRITMVNKSLEALNLPLLKLDEPGKADAIDTQLLPEHPAAPGTQMPILPKYLRDNMLQVLLYHPLELHKPEVLREVAAYASNRIICPARNLLHHLGYVQSEYSEETVSEAIDRAVRDHIAASISDNRHDKHEVLNNEIAHWDACREYRFDDELKDGFP